MEGIKVHKNVKLRSPQLVVAWPGMGEVAFNAASYLIDTLKAQEFAEIASEDFFYPVACNIQNGILNTPELPSGKFYYWKNPAALKGSAVSKTAGLKPFKSDLVFFISNAQPDLANAERYCQAIISLAKTLKIKSIVGFAAMPQPIDHTQTPNVWFASTSKALNLHLARFNMNPMLDGQISGMNGLFLGLAKKSGLEGFCLLGEIPLYAIQIDNPKAACAVLDALARVLNLKIDFSKLLVQAHNMEEEINKLLDFLKITPPVGPIGEDDIEKIKKSLSQLTKLPISIKEKIEQLFVQAKSDLTKAGLLKQELDKWNVYKEYEDRFLDLFRKTKENNN